MTIQTTERCGPGLRGKYQPCGIADVEQRPVLEHELMICMGWRKQDWYPGFRMEDLGSMQRLLGNSMHLGNVTSVLAVAMACAKA